MKNWKVRKQIFSPRHPFFAPVPGQVFLCGKYLYNERHKKFFINFNGAHPSVLEELEEDWLIIEQSSDFMHFKHTSGGNGDTDVI